MVPLRSASRQANRLAVRQPDEVQQSVAIEIDGAEHLGRHIVRQRLESRSVAQPDSRKAGNGRQDIERPVVVEIGKKDVSAAGRLPSRQSIPPGDLLLDPSSIRTDRGTPDGSARIERHEIQDTISVQVARRQRNYACDSWSRDGTKLSRLAIFEHVYRALLVEHHGVRITVAVEIRPDEVPQSGDPGKRLHRAPRSVAVVSQHDRRCRVHPHDEIQVAVHFDVGRPHAVALCGDRGRTSRGIGGPVGKRPVSPLQQQPQPALARERKIHTEVAIPVEGKDRVRRNDRRSAAGKRQAPARRAKTTNLTGIGSKRHRCARAVERHCQHGAGRRGRRLLDPLHRITQSTRRPDPVWLRVMAAARSA